MNKKELFDQILAEEPSTKTKLFYSAIRLFAEKGYANVGIRELCRSVNIKESAFYNHYDSKDQLYEKILSFFDEASQRVVFTEEEIAQAVAGGDVRRFFRENMEKFAAVTGDPVYQTVLQIVLMESYIHREAYRIAKKNLYYLRKDYTEAVLSGLMAQGSIRQCNVKKVTAEYYYTLKGLLDEYLLLDTWGDDTGGISQRIGEHIDFFADLLEK